MRAMPTSKTGAASFEELKPVCQILILHEDFTAYSRAVEVCRRVMERFASELDFDIKCWNFIELADPNCARHAAKSAGASDIILLSMDTAETTAELDRWLADSFTSRFRPEGVLALVLNHPASPPPVRQKLIGALESRARRLGLDFLCLPPDDDGTFLNLRPPAPTFRTLA
jgi:hypothetical protein